MTRLQSIYPLRSLNEAEHRLRHLGTLLRVATGRLAWIAKARGGVPYVDLQHEYDALRLALVTMRGLAQVPGCSCGKKRHPTAEQAERHRQALLLISAEGAERLARLSVYACDEQAGAWHVGHRRGRAGR